MGLTFWPTVQILAVFIGQQNYVKLAATLRGSRPGVQSASVIMTSLI